MSSSDLSPSAAARAQHLDPICSGRPPAVPRQPPPPAPLRAAAAACRGTSAPRAALRGGRREAGTLSGTGAAAERCFGRGEPRDKRYILGVRSGVSAAVRAGARSSRSPLFVAAAFFSMGEGVQSVLGKTRSRTGESLGGKLCFRFRSAGRSSAATGL